MFISIEGLVNDIGTVIRAHIFKTYTLGELETANTYSHCLIITTANHTAKFI